MARTTITSTACLVVLGLSLIACDAKQDPYKLPEKKTVDLHKIDNQMSEEELVAARKAAGIKSPEEVAAENAAWYETECRKYIKGKLPDYRKLVADMSAFLDDFEKQAPKWKTDAAFDKYAEKHKKKVAEYWTFYDETTGKGGEGGNTQILISAAVDAFEQLNNDIGVGVAENEAFPGALEEIRGHLEKITAALDEIEKDDSLEAGDTEGEPAADKPADKPKK